MMFALLVGMGAVSMTALYGCAAAPAAGDAQANAEPAAAPAGAADAAAAPAPADTAAAAPPAQPAPEATADASEPIVPDGTLQARVKAALAKHNLGIAHIGVSTREGVVRLSGAVASSVQIDQAQYVVGEVEGVREIDNQLKVSHK
jgi:hypothetical protein